MTSPAQQFRTLHSEWFHKEQSVQPVWPFLEEGQRAGWLLPVDLAFAALYKPASEAVAAILCYLLAAARQGHLYVEFQKSLLPSPSSLWPALPQELAARWTTLCKEGIEKLPPALLSHPDPLALSPLPTTPLCAYQNRYYLQKNWVYETRFACHLCRLEGTRTPIAISEAELPQTLQPEQKDAIRHACEHNVTFISGGPGTGKTFTAGHLASLCIQKDPHLRHVALLAPTGKAAVRLQASLLERLSPLPETLSVTCATLHKILGISPYRKDPKYHALSPLPHDLFIVDEASMIDVRLMADLLAAVKDGARVIFLGDKDQLPPVEAGALFAEIAYTLPNKTVSLKRSLRTDSDELGALALAVREGCEEKVLALLQHPSSTVGFHSLEYPFRGGVPSQNFQDASTDFPLQPEPIAQAMGEGCSGEDVSDIEILGRTTPLNGYSLKTVNLIETLSNRFPAFLHTGWDLRTPPEELLASQNFCLLSPVRQGPFGVNTMNQKVARTLALQQKPLHWPITPVLIVQNDPKIGLYNGEVGLLVTPYQGEEPPFAWFTGPDGQVRKLTASCLPDYEPAFCLSVHKSQGSEFESVALLLPPGSAVFGRKMLYTAITRAKQRLDLYGEADVLKEVLKGEGNRLSGCSFRLRER